METENIIVLVVLGAVSVCGQAIYLYCKLKRKRNAREQDAPEDPACDPNIGGFYASYNAAANEHVPDYRPGRHYRHYSYYRRHGAAGPSTSGPSREAPRQQSAAMYEMQTRWPSCAQQPTAARHATFMERYRNRVYAAANIPSGNNVNQNKNSNEEPEVPPPYTEHDMQEQQQEQQQQEQQEQQQEQQQEALYTIRAPNDQPLYIGRNSSIRCTSSDSGNGRWTV
ncbi:MAG: hypothetical protein STHCBS139747_006649 [Sporothrix thermara]